MKHYNPLEQFRTVEEVDSYRISTLHIPVLGDPVKSGDFYNLLRARGNYFLQGDYVGKSRPDSVIDEYEKEIRRLEAGLKQVNLNPKDVIAMIDGWFQVLKEAEGIGEYGFFSLSCSRLDENKVRYASAGHEFPIFLNGSSKIMRKRCRERLIGVDSAELNSMPPARTEYEVEMPRGSKIVIFTDGWPDMRDESGKIGHGRVNDFLETHRKLEGPRILNKLAGFMQKTDIDHYKETRRHGINDDITVSIIERC